MCLIIPSKVKDSLETAGQKEALARRTLDLKKFLERFVFPKYSRSSSGYPRSNCLLCS